MYYISTILYIGIFLHIAIKTCNKKNELILNLNTYLIYFLELLLFIRTHCIMLL